MLETERRSHLPGLLTSLDARRRSRSRNGSGENNSPHTLIHVHRTGDPIIGEETRRFNPMFTGNSYHQKPIVAVRNSFDDGQANKVSEEIQSELK
jgi:hypothetical protein